MWEQNRSSFAQNVQERELNRMLRSAKDDYGIRQESIGTAVGKIEQFLDERYYGKMGVYPSDIATFIYKAWPNWHNKGIALLIETSEPDAGNKNNAPLKEADLRECFGEICMFRFLVYNAKLMGKIISSYRMSEIITQLSTFDQSRFSLVDELSTTPCLFIKEVDLKDNTRDTNDCVSLIDSFMFNRIKHSKPTIISLTVLAEKFASPEKFGKCFSGIVQTIDKNKVFKIRLK